VLSLHLLRLHNLLSFFIDRFGNEYLVLLILHGEAFGNGVDYLRKKSIERMDRYLGDRYRISNRRNARM
jgi:hypothetical protein